MKTERWVLLSFYLLRIPWNQTNESHVLWPAEGRGGGWMKSTRLSSQRRRLTYGQSGITAQEGGEDVGTEADVMKGAQDEM